MPLRGPPQISPALRRFLLVLSFGILTLTASLPCRSARSFARGGCLNVLFIGDSLTYANNLPRVFSELARSKGACARAAMVAQPGESLKDHWVSGDAVRAIRSGRWSFVVLQDQSTFGEVYLVNGIARIHDADDLFDYGGRLANVAKTHGSIPVAFLPWSQRGSNLHDERFLRWAYETFARREGAMVAPAGIAWRVASRRVPGASLYRGDGLHPTSGGTYLTAALFLAVLAKVNPEGAASTILGQAVDLDTGAIKESAPVLLADISPDVARALQRVAWDVTQSPVASTAKPAPIKVPRLGVGEPIDLRALTGMWVGFLDVYPYSATLRLEICRTEPTVRGVVDFGGRPESVTFFDRSPKLGSTTLVFTDRKGPNGGVVRYQAIRDGTVLRGIAEILVKRAPIYGIGTWSLSRRSSPTACAQNLHGAKGLGSRRF
jgi:hypothetical protein